VIVIDASALVKYILKEQGWEKVEEHLHQSDSLELIQLEATNAIWKNYYLKRITKKDSIKGFQVLEALCEKVLTLHESRVYLDEAFKYSIQEKVPIYDVLYIMLAMNESAILVTSDKKQAKLASKLGIKVKSV